MIQTAGMAVFVSLNDRPMVSFHCFIKLLCLKLYEWGREKGRARQISQFDRYIPRGGTLNMNIQGGKSKFSGSE